MTESDLSPDLEEVDPPLAERQMDGRDTLLDIVYGSLTSGRGSFSLTLVVGGQVIDGQAISYKTWELLLRQQMRSAKGDAENVERVSDALAKIWTSADEERAEIEADPSRFYSTQMIHLCDVGIGYAGMDSPAAVRSKLMRVRLDAIDAWSIGSREKPETDLAAIREEQ